MKRYFKSKKIAENYFEVDYIEYREDGTAKCSGSEDFSRERIKTLHIWDVCTPTGKLNKGNQRMWKSLTTIRTYTAKEARKIAESLYPDMELRLTRL